MVPLQSLEMPRWTLHTPWMCINGPLETWDCMDRPLNAPMAAMARSLGRIRGRKVEELTPGRSLSPKPCRHAGAMHNLDCLAAQYESSSMGFSSRTRAGPVDDSVPSADPWVVLVGKASTRVRASQTPPPPSGRPSAARPGRLDTVASSLSVSEHSYPWRGADAGGGPRGNERHASKKEAFLAGILAVGSHATNAQPRYIDARRSPSSLPLVWWGICDQFDLHGLSIHSLEIKTDRRSQEC